MPQISVVIDNAVLMDKFFTERDLSSIAPVPFFTIASVEWGYGFVEEIDGKPSVTNIPTDSKGLESVLHENTPDRSYVNNEINMRCVLPAGVVEKGKVFNVSALNIKDAKGNSIAICAVIPIPVTSDRLLQFDVIIKVQGGAV